MQKKASEKMKQLNWLHDAPFGKISFNLGRYHSFAEIINYLNALAVTYPDRVRVMPIGTTHEGRQIPLIKVSIFLDLFSNLLSTIFSDYMTPQFKSYGKVQLIEKICSSVSTKSAQYSAYVQVYWQLSKLDELILCEIIDRLVILSGEWWRELYYGFKELRRIWLGINQKCFISGGSTVRV